MTTVIHKGKKIQFEVDKAAQQYYKNNLHSGARIEGQTPEPEPVKKKQELAPPADKVKEAKTAEKPTEKESNKESSKAEEKKTAKTKNKELPKRKK